MTLETGVKELAEAVGADVRALDAGKVNSNDPRLTDAREWTADNVTREEAEAGNSLIRRAWSARRVRQAIEAWYLTVSTTFTRTLLGRSTAAQVRGDLELGTAATRDVGESGGNMMEVGAFGLGRTIALRLPSDDADSLRVTGIYSTPDDWVGAPYAGVAAANQGALIHTQSFHFNDSWAIQKWVSMSAGVDYEFTRQLSNGVWQPWRETLTTSNIQSTTGQSTQYPMTQKAVTEAIAARGFADASGVLTVTSGALSNDMSAFLSLKTKAEIIAWLAD